MCKADEVKCVANLSVGKQNCLKKCSGLLVTSFEKNNEYQSERFITKLSTKYWSYKGYFQFPKDFKG